MNRNYFRPIQNKNYRKEYFQTLSNTTSTPPPNPIPIFPSMLPSTSQLYDSSFSSYVAILNMYFIQLFVYFFDNNIDSLAISDALNLINTSNLLPSGAVVVNLLIYSCIHDTNTTSYGGMIVEYNATSFIVLRGTQSTGADGPGHNCEWVMDSTEALVTPNWIDPIKYPGVLVHSGFNQIYTISFANSQGITIPSLREQIYNYISLNRMNNLIITGHSLGGGICYLLAADLAANLLQIRLNTKIYTVAGPYSGNQQFINIITSPPFSEPNYTGVFAIINTADKVPETKLRFGYERIPSQLFCFTIPGNIKDAHAPSTYREGLENNGSIFDKNVTIGCSSCGIDCKPTVETYTKNICPCCRK